MSLTNTSGHQLSLPPFRDIKECGVTSEAIYSPRERGTMLAVSGGQSAAVAVAGIVVGLFGCSLLSYFRILLTV
jgi:hypothetical protein